MEARQIQEDERSIDLLPLFKALLAKLWLMIFFGMITGSIVFGVTKVLIKPVYRCGFTAYINNQQSQIDKNIVTSSDLVAAQQLTKTYGFIIQSNTVLSASLKAIQSDIAFEDFKKMVNTEIKDETELISVYVKNQDPDMAYQLANAVAKTAPKYMSQIVEGSSMKIVDYPEPTVTRYGPSYVKYGVVGFLFGVLLIMIKTIIFFFQDDRVKSDQQIEESFDIPILGIIPNGTSIGQQKNGHYYYSYYGSGYGGNSKKNRNEKGDE